MCLSVSAFAFACACVHMRGFLVSDADIDTIMSRCDSLPFTPVDPHQPVPVDVIDYHSIVMAEEEDYEDDAADDHGDEVPDQLGKGAGVHSESDDTMAPTESTGRTLPLPPSPFMSSLQSMTISSTQPISDAQSADNGYGCVHVFLQCIMLRMHFAPR
jgi:hypothetical protein